MRKQKRNISVPALLVLLLCFALVLAGYRVHNHFSSAEPSNTEVPTSTPEEPPITIAEEQNRFTVPVSVSNYRPQETDSSSFESGWYLNTSNGNVQLDSSFNKINANVSYAGDRLEDTCLYRDGIPLEQGKTYTLQFNGFSSVPSTLRLIVRDLNTDQVILSHDFSLIESEQFYSASITMNTASTFNAQVAFYFGNPNIGSYAFTLSGLRVIADDPIRSVFVNQVGYATNGEKRCTFPYNAGDLFDLVQADTNEIVYTGPLLGKTFSEAVLETDYYGDFSTYTTPGRYYIRSQIGVVSAVFYIQDDPYASLSASVLDFFRNQECGSSLGEEAGALAHDSCHTQEATFWLTETHKDVSGGWHDAGDYGRYVKTGTKAVNDLLMSTLFAKNMDNARALTLAHTEIDWLLKMQTENGSVYSKVVTQQFPDDFLAPQDDHADLYLLSPLTTTTADFAGTMALASLVYQDIDTSYANQCLAAAVQAWHWLKDNPDLKEDPNPTEFQAGSYRDDSDTDGRFTAAILLYLNTHTEEYLQSAMDLYAKDNTCASGLSWQRNGGYGRFLYAVAGPDSAFRTELIENLLQEADGLLNAVNSNAYNVSLTSYQWGSNAEAAENGVLLSMAYQLTGKEEYQRAAYDQLHYLLGRNSLDQSFVTGYGSNSPCSVHNRLMLSSNSVAPGALVGGPDSSFEDTITSTLDHALPPAKVYVDQWQSYSTNETAINYNSAFYALLSCLRG